MNSATRTVLAVVGSATFFVAGCNNSTRSDRDTFSTTDTSTYTTSFTTPAPATSSPLSPGGETPGGGYGTTTDTLAPGGATGTIPGGPGGGVGPGGASGTVPGVGGGVVGTPTP